MQYKSTNKITSIEILNEEMKSVVFEKHDFENRDGPILRIWRFFWLARF